MMAETPFRCSCQVIVPCGMQPCPLSTRFDTLLCQHPDICCTPSRPSRQCAIWSRTGCPCVCSFSGVSRAISLQSPSREARRRMAIRFPCSTRSVEMSSMSSPPQRCSATIVPERQLQEAWLFAQPLKKLADGSPPKQCPTQPSPERSLVDKMAMRFSRLIARPFLAQRISRFVGQSSTCIQSPFHHAARLPTRLVLTGWPDFSALCDEKRSISTIKSLARCSTSASRFLQKIQKLTLYGLGESDWLLESGQG
ncbi:hypothetical protein QBC39DRAFT_47687 [Podospora conica]|nr:hypothetical protein QBC39DRAFT_47687 [Schizothecium conicum]